MGEQHDGNAFEQSYPAKDGNQYRPAKAPATVKGGFIKIFLFRREKFFSIHPQRLAKHFND